MKKLLFLLVALVGAGMMWATCPEGFTDKVNATQYLKDIKVDIDKATVTFTDTYRPDTKMGRLYSVYAYRDAGECPFYHPSQGSSYIYGGKDNAHGIIMGGMELSGWGEEKKGGTYTYDISQVLEKIISKGYSSVYLAFKPYFVSLQIGGEYTPYYHTEDGKDIKNLWLVNGVNITIPTIAGLGITLPNNAHFEQDMNVRVDMTCMHRCSYILSYSKTGSSWTFIKSDIIEAYEAKNAAFRNITFRPIRKNVKELYFRLEVTDLVSDYKQTFTTEKPLSVLYPLDNGGIMWYEVGKQVEIPYEDCKDIQISAYLPTSIEHKSDKVIFTMPACKVSVSQIAATYTVKFYNADYSLLKTEEVKCGEDATPPANPTLGTYPFTGWDKDYTNVQKDLKVFAKYNLKGDYYLMPSQSEHKNEVYEYYGFKDNETRVMVGDVLNYKIGVLAGADATLYYETAQWSNSEQKWLWSDHPVKVADYEYVPSNPQKIFDSPDIQVCYDKNIEYIHSFEYRFAVRFYMYLAGQNIYSDPFEYDVFYPLTIKTADGSEVMAESNAGYYHVGSYMEFPARTNDTLWVYGWTGAGGKCFQFSPSVPNDIDANGNAYFLAPGEKTTITVSTSKYAVVFDEAFPTQSYNFTDKGLGTYNAYYAEVVPCGGAVANMPADPTSDGQIFKGWYNNSPDKYADDDYMHVPAVSTPYITFSAKWENIPDAQKYTVRFYGKDGSPLLDTQTIDEGQNATPPTPPTVDGWHFVGWDKPYTTIVANIDITALYGEDAKNWIITYYDEDGKTKMGEETVADKMPANGLKIYKEGKNFKYWFDMDKDAVADFSSITADMNVKAVFESPTPPPPTPDPNYYKVTLVAKHGKISVKETGIDLSKVEENTVLHFTATPDEDYEFKSWKNYDPATGLTVTEDVTVEAVFEQKAQEGLEGIRTQESGVRKVIIDGQLYLMYNGKMYNVQGAAVK